jgi:hypothetical protein
MNAIIDFIASFDIAKHIAMGPFGLLLMPIVLFSTLLLIVGFFFVSGNEPSSAKLTEDYIRDRSQ